jgi:hypothetical protein
MILSAEASGLSAFYTKAIGIRACHPAEITAKVTSTTYDVFHLLS